MFFTFYELSANASILETLIFFFVHGMVQLIGTLAFILLLVYVAAEQVLAFFYGRHEFDYHRYAQRFSGGAMLLAFAVIGLTVGAGYWLQLPSENQWVGWTAVFPIIVVCLFFACFGLTFMVKSWNELRAWKEIWSR